MHHSPVPPVRSTTGFDSRAPPPRSSLHPDPRLADLLHTPFVPRAIEAPGCTFPGSTGAGEEWPLTTPRPAARCLPSPLPPGHRFYPCASLCILFYCPFGRIFVFCFLFLFYQDDVSKDGAGSWCRMSGGWVPSLGPHVELW